MVLKLVAEIVQHKIADWQHYSRKTHSTMYAVSTVSKCPIQTAWRARDPCCERLAVFLHKGHDQMLHYLASMVRANPGLYILFLPKNGYFYGWFMSFDKTLNGFTYFRPILSVGAFHLKSTFQAQLLAACAQDGKKGTFPIAVIVLDQEDYDNPGVIFQSAESCDWKC